MNPLNETAYCGLYCKDCMHYKNNYSIHAQRLIDELKRIEFREYAKINSGFKANLENFDIFSDVLKTLAAIKCDKTCRVGGGCSGNPCTIMKCCLSKDHEGCWECNEIGPCEKFDILTPVCGENPKINLSLIKKHGVESWVDFRKKFYIWQK
jgi:hypothetical protein